MCVSNIINNKISHGHERAKVHWLKPLISFFANIVRNLAVIT